MTVLTRWGEPVASTAAIKTCGAGPLVPSWASAAKAETIKPRVATISTCFIDSPPRKRQQSFAQPHLSGDFAGATFGGAGTAAAGGVANAWATITSVPSSAIFR